MIKELLNDIKNMDKSILKIMFSGFKFSFIICIISCLTLLCYIQNPISYIIFDSGIILFKTSIAFAVSFFICAFVMDKIKKQLI